MDAVVWLNGEFVAAETARIGVFDGGWLHGAGLFETMRAENGRVFRLESHLQRLQASAARLLRPIAREELPSRVDFLDLLERNGLRDARVRLTVSAGDLLAATGDEPPPPSVCVSVADLSPFPASAYSQGVRVKLCDFRQSPTDPVAGHKTTAYHARLLALREAQRAQCMESLWFTTQNHLAEGCISNVFLVGGGMLKTPAKHTPVLPGIVREAVLSLASELGIEAREALLSIDDLLGAEEVFLTNSMMQVLPVSAVERHGIGGGGVGPLTRRLSQAFVELVRKECGLA
ncbi:MAG: aminotransferase class IV family protein [Planctomycetes bacterium]|nr:aminotransferase class IV family protein [Planctomycetota bacterium]